jgi:hypothetical protein
VIVHNDVNTVHLEHYVKKVVADNVVTRHELRRLTRCGRLAARISDVYISPPARIIYRPRAALSLKYRCAALRLGFASFRYLEYELPDLCVFGCHLPRSNICRPHMHLMYEEEQCGVHP